MSGLGNFFKEKLSHFYVLFLIFLIPILIIANGLWRINVYQSNINASLNQQTKLLANVLASALSDDVAKVSEIDQEITAAKASNNSVEDITLFASSNNDFTAISSTNSEFNQVNFLDSDLLQVANEGKTIIREYKNTDVSPSKRYWLSLAPVVDANGQTRAILAIKTNSSEIDQMSRTAINISLVSLVFTVFIVFLLLVNHFRFFEYFVNYRKIQEVDKMKDEFISIVSHELKTPLATVKGYMDMMFQGLTGKFDDKTKEHLLKINMNILRLDLLVNELLDVSRIEQDRLQYDMQPIDMFKVTEGVITEIGEKATSKGLKVDHKPLAQMPPIFADSDRVGQIIENIFSNAIKYTAKGSITISYKLDKGKLITSISDTGIGMSAADMKRLFERFYRIKNEKTMDISGTGLGLWIARAIAKHMNGDITVTSKENAGSTFNIIFPFIKE